MIQELYIKDFVLIHEARLSLRPGFTAITGETGAGKSILIGAIGLILGARADSRMIREGATKAIIEAECHLGGLDGLQQLFEEHELDYEEVTVLRRELTASGKSRAFVNDTPVSLSLLREVGARLVDIHSQHHNMLIGDAGFQMSVIDALAANASLRSKYAHAYATYQKVRTALMNERRYVTEKKQELDYITYQWQQLHDAKLKPGEYDELEQRLTMIHHSRDIAEALSGASALLSDDDSERATLPHLHTLTTRMGRVADRYPPVALLYERMVSLVIELKDIAAEADELLEEMDTDAEAAAAAEERIDMLQSLMVKHNLRTVEELIELRDKYEAEIGRVNSSEDRIQELKQEVEKAHTALVEIGEKLTQSRAVAIEGLLGPLHELLGSLGIAGATFEVPLERLERPAATGLDSLSFVLATNKKNVLRPIHEIASGGEISRIMLALKTILSERATLPTVIFDEIDTGVSGEVAEKLGQVMRRMSRHLQVITITHLPQIAALADTQMVVAKHEEANEGYVTQITEVTGDARVDEITAMLSGSHRTQAARDNAIALLKSAHVEL